MNAPRQSIALLVVLLTATAFAAAATGSVVPRSQADMDVVFQQEAENTSVNASITIENQTRNGNAVFVESVTLPEGGFVVLEKPNGSIVGVSLPLASGTHQGKITFRGVPGADRNLTRLGANTTLVATVHRDSNDNGRFDGLLAPSTDEPYTVNGTPVSDRAHVTIPEEEQPTTANVIFTNQTTNGTNITIASVTLPDGGYVGIHRSGYNGSNATESMVDATGYLEPGTYENVTVELGTGVRAPNGSVLNSGRVSAVVYADTDSDREFQYVPSGGIEDQPYLTNGTPVAASAFVTVERPATPTPTPTPTATQTPATETSVPTPTATADSPPEPQPAERDRATPYGGTSNAREGILENPLFPLLVFVFAVFAVLAAIGR